MISILISTIEISILILTIEISILILTTQISDIDFEYRLQPNMNSVEWIIRSKRSAKALSLRSSLSITAD